MTKPTLVLSLILGLGGLSGCGDDDHHHPHGEGTHVHEGEEGHAHHGGEHAHEENLPPPAEPEGTTEGQGH